MLDSLPPYSCPPASIHALPTLLKPKDRLSITVRIKSQREREVVLFRGDRLEGEVEVVCDDEGGAECGGLKEGKVEMTGTALAFPDAPRPLLSLSAPLALPPTLPRSTPHKIPFSLPELPADLPPSYKHKHCPVFAILYRGSVKIERAGWRKSDILIIFNIRYILRSRPIPRPLPPAQTRQAFSLTRAVPHSSVALPLPLAYHHGSRLSLMVNLPNPSAVSAPPSEAFHLALLQHIASQPDTLLLRPTSTHNIKLARGAVTRCSPSSDGRTMRVEFRVKIPKGAEPGFELNGIQLGYKLRLEIKTALLPGLLPANELGETLVWEKRILVATDPAERGQDEALPRYRRRAEQPPSHSARAQLEASSLPTIVIPPYASDTHPTHALAE